MSMIRDMMPGFELFQPATAEDAVALLERYGEDGWALAGGLDTFDWFKDRVKRPRAVVDLGGIESLRGIRAGAGGGLEIGYFQSLSGSKNAAFLMRAGGIVSWHAAEPLYLEAQVPEILVLSSGGGIVAVGASVRLGIRF